MSATYDVARDEIQAEFNTAWVSNTPAVTPDSLVPEVFWQGAAEPEEKPAKLPWARVAIQHNVAGQGALSNAAGSRLWERFGFVTIQIFVPLELGQGLSLDAQLATIAKNAYEGKHTASSVWFRNVRINEVGEEGVWFRTDVIADFTYDEVKT